MRASVLLAVLLLGVPFAARAGDDLPADLLDWARRTVAERLPDAPPAPDFPADRTWLNVAHPLSLAKDLKGKVVLLDFWTYCCINCMHVLPDLEHLEARYGDKGLAVVGVHSAKFENEKDTAQIREAIRRYGIHHPVVNDHDFAVWNAYGARSWPTFVLVAPDGRLVGGLSGEGNRPDLEALVVALLERYAGRIDATPLPLRPEADTRPPGALAYPGKILVGPEGKRFYVADSNHNRIVETDAEARFLRAFGDGEPGLRDGPADRARFRRPQGMAIHAGALWVCDTENHAIRRVDIETGTVTTVAGTGQQGDHWALVKPGREGEAHGPWPGRTTALNSPWDVEPVGDVLWIAMAGSHSLWTLDPATAALRHVAGDLTERRLDSEDPLRAAFAQPSGLTFDGTHLWVADSESSAIVRVDPQGGVTTVAGGSANPKDLFHFGDEDGRGRGRRFQHPLDVLFHDGVLYVADSYNHKVKTVDRASGTVRTLFGTGRSGAEDGREGARFAEPGGLAAFEGVLLVADTNNHAVRGAVVQGDGPQVGEVKTVVLRGIPIPPTHATKGGVGTSWPTMAGTVFEAPRTVQLAADASASLVVRLELPEGWALTEGAPSVLRVEVGETVTDARIAAREVSVLLPTLEAGTREGRLRLLYYVCREGGECRVRSVDVPLAVEVVPGAPAAVVVDRYEP
jgi:thiol-disulfide isomerase/thioredoxin